MKEIDVGSKLTARLASGKSFIAVLTFSLEEATESDRPSFFLSELGVTTGNKAEYGHLSPARGHMKAI